MKKLSEYQDADALDLLADIMEPAVEIMGDEEVRKAFDESKLHGASVAIKRHNDSVLDILARLEGVARKDYHCNVFTLPARVLEVLNDQELLTFFSEQAVTVSTAAHSGEPTETTGDGAA